MVWKDYFLTKFWRIIIKHYSSLRNRTFSKDIVAIIRDSSDGSEQSKLETFWKRVHLVDAIKIICDS